MATHEAQLKRRLGRVRLRWRMTTALRGLLLVVTEALGIFLLLLLADWIYHFGGTTRLIGLLAGAAVLAALATRHCLWPLLRPIRDEQVALLIEERSGEAAGAVVSAVEFRADQGTSLHRSIINFLVDDAVRRLDRVPLRAVSNLRRLRKHAIAAGLLLAAFAVTSLTAPSLLRQGAARVIAPWVSIRQERQQAEEKAQSHRQLLLDRAKPLEFAVAPGDQRLKRGSSLPVKVRFNRAPAEKPYLAFRKKGQTEKDFRTLPDPMAEVPGVYDYAMDLPDLNESMEYRIEVVEANGVQRSRNFVADVFDPLGVRAVEVTAHYPDYLELEPRTMPGEKIVTVPVGSKVDLRVLSNNPLAAGEVKLKDGQALPLKLGAKPEDGGTVSLTVDRDVAYEVSVTDRDGQKSAGEQFYYIKAAPDEPPTLEILAPKVDMSIQPISEVTFRAKVTDDWGVKDATVFAEIFHEGQKTPNIFPMTLSDEAGRTKNIASGTAEFVYQAELGQPRMQVGDSMFYHLEITDRKGQKAVSDIFFIQMMPLEVAAIWPSTIHAPSKPHATYETPASLMTFLAATWKLQQQRPTMPVEAYNAECDKFALQMEVPDHFDPSKLDYGAFFKKPMGGPPDAMLKYEQAVKEVELGHDQLKLHEAGQAVDHMRLALAIYESIHKDKSLLGGMAMPESRGGGVTAPTGDAVSEQFAFKTPSLMSDDLRSMTNPEIRNIVNGPDYRRQVKAKERESFKSKQLKEAGRIYASEEALVAEALRMIEQRMYRPLAESAYHPKPANPAKGGGEERVDDRALPKPEDKNEVAQGPGKPKPQAPQANVKTPETPGERKPNQGEKTPGEPQQGQPQQNNPDAAKPNDGQPNEKQPKDGQPNQGQPNQGQPNKGQPNQGQPNQGDPAGAKLAENQEKLAGEANELAMNVARNLTNEDPLAAKAAEDLRTAAGEMKKASEAFRRGDVEAGAKHAKDAQKTFREATNRLKASQYDSLEQALAAAQAGAVALAGKQRQISDATRQTGERINELTGKTDPTKGEAGKTDPTKGEAGKTDPTKGEAGKNDPTKGEAGKNSPTTGEAGKNDPSKGEPGKNDLAKVEPGKNTPTTGQAGKPGKDAPSGKGEEAMPTPDDLAKAANRDPRLPGRLGDLAGKQADVKRELEGFGSYVDDLQKWAKDAAKERVAGSLEDVNKDIRRNDTAQKIVDAAVGLSEGNVKSARTAQKEVEKQLDDMVAGVSEAGELLAGSQTGVLRQAARQAKSVGEQVASLTGKGEPNKGEPGKGEPGKGEPKKGEGSELAQKLAQQDQNPTGRPGSGKNDDIPELWLKTRRLVTVLKKEGLADDQTLRYVDRRSGDIDEFKKLFERANRVEAGKFSDVMLGVGNNLQAALAEALSANRLNAEMREECPPAYRALVNAYFEALSKAATRNP